MARDHVLRTHNCGELRTTDVSNDVTLCGWVHTQRDHGGVLFVDLRDRYGLTQVVFEPAPNDTLFRQADELRREWVIEVSGVVRLRDKEMVNTKIDTGEIEVVAKQLTVLNRSDVPPFALDEYSEVSDHMRLKFRYLDLRRPEMQRHLKIRHLAARATRDYLTKAGFLDIETPMLVRSTPEGARDFLVPCRLNPGTFYSLPQSPQLYKQVLMVSGVDRYFQIARCMRDEDLRADRQPEFTQIDIEASFIKEEFIYELVEGLMKRIFKETIGADIKTPFRRFTYAETMERYGCDKPDLRFDLPLFNVTDIVRDSDFSVFQSVLQKNGVVKCVNPMGEFSKKNLEDYIAFCQGLGAKGMAWMRVTDQGLDSNIVKYFSDPVQKALLEKTGARPGSTLMFIADKPARANDIISRLRNELGKNLGLIKPGVFAFCWVTDFPLFEYDEKEKKIAAAHHVFTMPKEEHLPLLDSDPLKVLAQSYDLVLNGIELASGSIRIHDPEIQKRVLDVIGVSSEEAERKFGFLLEAFKYGAPPHGGIAPGFDRIVALLCGFNDIREVIAFPKTQSGTSLLDGCPSKADPAQLRELKIRLSAPPK